MTENSWRTQVNNETKHPNRRLFTGVLCLLDTPSDRKPLNSRGHTVLLTSRAARNAVKTLLGMAVNTIPMLNGHNNRQKVGVITAAKIKDKKLVVDGFLYSWDFPDVIEDLENMGDLLGMSFETANAHITDTQQIVWCLDKVTFTGASILLKSSAAYRNTSFTLLPK